MQALRDFAKHNHAELAMLGWAKPLFNRDMQKKGARSMSTMVKRVAQALQQEMATAPLDEAASFALAHAAIAAMREPTEEMLDAWIRAPGAIKGDWEAMIDAALEARDH
jgi:surface antigen